MNYKVIIQELKESADHNVLAFVKEVEHMKRLTTQKRHFYLRNRHDPEAVRLLINDYIPYIIRVAYECKDRNRKMSVLDLINEGILGAYAALEKDNVCGRTMSENIRLYINKYVSNVVENNGCSSEEDFFSHERSLDNNGDEMDEDDIIKEIDHERERMLLKELLDRGYGARNCNIIMDYYFNSGQDCMTVAIKYGISRERVRQIVNEPMKCKGSDLWKMFSEDFNLPVNEAYLRRRDHNND